MHFDTPQYNWKEAALLGNSDKATILTFIRWSIASKQGEHCQDRFKDRYLIEGVWWMQDGYAAWEARFPWLNKRTINTYLNDLFAKGAILKRAVGSLNNGREPNFYRINPAWDEMMPKIGNSDIDALKANFALGGYEAIFALVESNFCSRGKEKFAHISTSNNLTHKSSQNSPETGPTDLPAADALGGELGTLIIIDPIERETLELAAQWVATAKALMPSQSSNKLWTAPSFAKQFQKVMEKTDLNNGGIAALMRMIPTHKFWATKALSPFGWLNKSRDDKTMRKIDFMLADLRNSKEHREYRAAIEMSALLADPNYKAGF